MLTVLSRRLLPLLQLTRMALVFTAIADSFTEAILLSASPRAGGIGGQALDPFRLLAIAAMSIGLYGFGMSLNDIIDRRRDRQMNATRPLPSGRVGIVTAHLICTLLGVGGCGAAGIYWALTGSWQSLVLVVWTGLLITFYDFSGKYLVAPGLITLGLIRFFHALAPAPEVPVIWHPLMLLNHVTILSAVGYYWEQKRPPLTKAHWWAVLGGLAGIDLLAIGVAAALSMHRGLGIVQGLRLTPALALPAAAAAAFVFIAWLIRRQTGESRQSGQSLMLYGLLWLIVYDATFVAAYVSWIDALLLLLLLPAAYLSVQLMRWWSKLVSASQRPQFKRARA
ncbi:MAG TPA: UbiA family prenyltransferase [Tepidisphaeraceae bacterium]|jgi:4-hydroxybenzoate polyprenyltransferase|nr:UbiA family prenyltransferase [Tepidisphaeraceae bacterium]